MACWGFCGLGDHLRRFFDVKTGHTPPLFLPGGAEECSHRAPTFAPFFDRCSPIAVAAVHDGVVEVCAENVVIRFLTSKVARNTVARIRRCRPFNGYTTANATEVVFFTCDLRNTVNLRAEERFQIGDSCGHVSTSFRCGRVVLSR